MLLRRVIEHVKAQNGFAVGIDFVIRAIAATLAVLRFQNNNYIITQRAAIEPHIFAEARN